MNNEAWRVSPTLIFGFGEAGSKCLDRVWQEVNLYQKDIIQYGIYQFFVLSSSLTFLSKKERDNFSQWTIDTEEDFQENKQKLKNHLLGVLRNLRGIALPPKENRYRIAGDPLIVNCFMVANLAAENGKIFTQCFLPFFIQLLEKSDNPVHIRLTFFLHTAVWNDSEEESRQIRQRLQEIHQWINLHALVGQVSVYTMGKTTLRGHSLKSKEQLTEMSSLFLEGILLADINSPAASRLGELILIGSTERPYSALGIFLLDFPILELWGYCTKKNFVVLSDKLISEQGEDFYIKGKELISNHSLQIDLPESQTEKPKLELPEFSKTVNKDVMKRDLIKRRHDWFSQMGTWTTERVHELNGHINVIKKKAMKTLRARNNMLLKQLEGMVKTRSNALYAVCRYLEGAESTLGAEKKQYPNKTLRIFPEPSFSFVSNALEELLLLLKKMPNRITTIFYWGLTFLLGSGLLLNLFWPVVGLLRLSVYIGIFLLFCAFLCYLSIVVPRQSFKSVSHRLQELVNSYPHDFEQKYLKPVYEGIVASYINKILSRMLANVKEKHAQSELLRALFDFKRSNFKKEIDKVKRFSVDKDSNHRQEGLQDSRFRSYVIKEKDFLDIYKRYIPERSLAGLAKEYQNECKCLEQMFDQSAYKLFEKTYEFVLHYFESLTSTDYLYRDYRDRAVGLLTKGGQELEVYLTYDVDKISGIEQVREKVFGLGKQDYFEIAEEIDKSKFMRLGKKDFISLNRSNRIYLCKILWGLPFESIEGSK